MTMTDKFMYIPNKETQNYPFCRMKFVVETLNTQPNKATYQNLLKLFSQRIRKHYNKTLGTSYKQPILSPLRVRDRMRVCLFEP